MKRKKYRVVAAALCAAFLLCGITTTAYAGGGEEWEDGTGGPEWEGLDPVAVSYTHLTLPTKLEV